MTLFQSESFYIDDCKGVDLPVYLPPVSPTVKAQWLKDLLHGVRPMAGIHEKGYALNKYYHVIVNNLSVIDSHHDKDGFLDSIKSFLLSFLVKKSPRNIVKVLGIFKFTNSSIFTVEGESVGFEFPWTDLLAIAIIKIKFP